MADLRERFAALDQVPARDVWADAVRRAAARQGQVATFPVERGGRSGASRLRGDSTGAFQPRRLGLPAYAVVALLLAAAIVGSLLVAGGYVHWPRLGLGFVPGPRTSVPVTSRPPGTEAPVASRPPVFGARAGQIPACPHATGFGDIVDTSSGHLVQSWQSADVNAHGEAASIVGNPDADGSELAVVGRDTDGRPNAVYLLPVDGSGGCVLAELSSRFDAQELVWSRAGDALAIAGTTATGAEVYVWSAIGMSRVWTGTAVPHLDWEPNGADLLVVADHVSIVSMFGTNTAFDPICDNVAGCGPVARGIWSPDGQQVAFEPPPDSGATRPNLVIMEIDARHAITYPQSGPFSILSWNDDRSLNLLAVDGTGGHVAHLTLPGSTTLHGTFPAGQTRAAFNAAGTDAAFLPEPGSHELTFRNDRGAESAIPVSISATVDAYQWSPSGTRLAFMTTQGIAPDSQGTIWIYPPADPSRQVVIPGSWVLLDFRTAAGAALGSWRPKPPVTP